MKFSINLADYVSNEYSSGVDFRSLDRTEVVKRIGEQLGAIEEINDFGICYQGGYIVRVETCEKHPDAEKLSICMIDDGNAVKDIERSGQGLIQVVCGAPNAKAGMYAVWLPPGMVVPSTKGQSDEFRLEARDIRGQKSNGMLASPKELAISDEHEGILEVTRELIGKQLSAGIPLGEIIGLDDLIIDCENKMFTHRPDCFGNMGVARELAGIFGLAYKSPDWYLGDVKQENLSDKLALESTNDIPELVPRFMAQIVDGVTIQPSPVWMQAGLNRVGIKPINNIVDWTNYYMHLTAQPTHAFDYDKLVKLCGSDKVTLQPRLARKGEKLTLLGGKTIELSEDDIVISCGDTAVALAGIIGGLETEVDDSTKTVVIECATFDMYSVRRSSMRHGIFTEALTRFNKGQSPLQNHRVLAKLVSSICGDSGAVPGALVDIKTETYQQLLERPPLEVSSTFVNFRLGVQLDSEVMAKLLRNVEFDVGVSEDKLTISPPFWRMDIQIAEDIVEEIGRLYGYDKIDTYLPSIPMRPARRNELVDQKNKLRDSLSRAGASEVLTYSFVHNSLMKKVGLDADKWAFHVRNALSPDLQFYRTALLPSLLDKVHANIRSDMVRGDDNEFAIFEIGKAHTINHLDSENGLPEEFQRLALVVTADEKTAKRKYQGSAYYHALEYLSQILSIEADISLVNCEHFEYPISSSYQQGRSAMIMLASEPVGMIGEIDTKVKERFKLPQHCAGFELDIELLSEALAKTPNYSPIGTFPKTQQDITLRVDDNQSHSDILNALRNILKQLAGDHGYEYRIISRDIFKKSDSSEKNLTFRIWLWHPHKTLKTEEVNELLDAISHQLKKELNAERV